MAVAMGCPTATTDTRPWAESDSHLDFSVWPFFFFFKLSSEVNDTMSIAKFHHFIASLLEISRWGEVLVFHRKLQARAHFCRSFA